MNEINYDEMSDEDFVLAMENASDEAFNDEDEDTTDTTLEDTDQSEDEAEEDDLETETNDLNDDDGDETEEDETDTDDETDEENSQLEKDEDETDTKNDKSEDEKTETETEADEADAKAETVNYEEEYKKILADNEKLKSFYDEVTSEFTANGKKMKGFTDPKKIKQSQQMAAGFSDKMAGFKPYRPFMGALKDRGILENPDKFNLAMSLLDGDPEAIKQHIKNLEIDPFEMDMENINYQSKNQVASSLEMAFDDILDNATKYNVKDKVQAVISKDWDDQSVIQLLEDPQSSADLVSHMSSGAYEIVQERIAEKKRIDVNDVYSRKPMIEQYREAATELEQEYAARNPQPEARAEAPKVVTPKVIDESEISKEVSRIATEREEREYRSKVEAENAKAAEARKKATSLSKKKPVTKAVKKVFDPGALNDEEFTKLIDDMAYRN